ncbi:MAG: LuxR C-terminal-related transcriptional regulator [Oscillospiraceae bacterium]|nr:LuxR C-terminal-related transcriptional regulator [Oscillospiraceae bacterium]
MDAALQPVFTPELQAMLQSGWMRCRIILFSAPCGYGKTTAVAALLQGRRTATYRAGEGMPFEPLPDCEALVVENLQLLQKAEEQRALCDWLQSNPDKHLILVGRGVTPGWLMPFRFTGLLMTIDADALLFDRATTGRLLAQNAIEVSDAELTAIWQETTGYPLALALLCRHLASGERYGKAVADAVRRELFLHYEQAVYLRFEVPLRLLLLNLAPFEQFDVELAKLVSGESHVGELLGRLQRETTMLLYDGLEQCRFRPLFRSFLLWEMRQRYTVAEQNTLCSRAGLYYELREDYAHALACYSRCAEHRKVTALLIKYAEHHPGVDHFYELEEYYYALPREEVLRSPALLCGMSMVTALNLDYEQSEQWYAALQTYVSRLQRSDAEFKDAQAKLAYLDIALPQRGSKGLIEIITSVFTILTSQELQLPTFSVTSSLPSILNGGKDFSEWTRRDELLYATMRKPVETILGRDGVGIADCALCESKFEKNEEFSARLLALASRLGEIQRKGTPDIRFAAVGLLCRVQVSQGKAATALDTLQNLRDDFVETGQTRFLPNLDAMCCRIRLRLGDLDGAQIWYREKAPGSGARLRALWRYQYITSAMVQITIGEWDAALVTLAPLLEFTRYCGRTLDGLTIRLLMAICHFRQADEMWRDEFAAALDTAWDYRYIRPVAQLGAAVLPLLNACLWKGDKDYFSRLLTQTRAQTVFYPDFLRRKTALAEPLSPSEQQVLRLICHNRSNQEIGDILGIKLATVKTHVNHILQKLDVKRRSEAKDAAESLHLI